MGKNNLNWEARFQELVEYKRVHGNCNVPREYKENPPLGSWVRKQRTKKETMSEERRKKLNSIGFTWKFRYRIPVPWEVRFQQLVDYKQVHRDCNVPHRYQPNPQLGFWVDTQRRNNVPSVYKQNPPLGSWVGKQRHKKETMSGERREKLNSIGFTWKVREAHILVDWEIRFQQLVEYKRVHGNCNVPWMYKENPQLGKGSAHNEQRRRQ